MKIILYPLLFNYKSSDNYLPPFLEKKIFKVQTPLQKNRKSNKNIGYKY